MEGLYALLRKIIRNQKKIIKEQKKQTRLLNELTINNHSSEVIIDGKETGKIMLRATDEIFVNGEQVAKETSNYI